MNNTKKNSEELTLLIELYNKTNNLQPIFDWIKTGNKKEVVKAESISEEALTLYDIYPNRCVIRGASLGKGSKNKIKLHQLLKSNSFSSIKKTIEDYIDDCISNKVYFKNFTTFLNNIEIVDDTKKKVDEQVKCLFEGGVLECLRSKVPNGAIIIG